MKREPIVDSKAQLKKTGHDVERIVSMKPTLLFTGFTGHGCNEEFFSFIENAVMQALQNILEGPYGEHLSKTLQVESKKETPKIRAPVRDVSGNEVIRPRDLQQVTGMSRTQIWRLEKAGLFVPRIRLSNGCVGFLRKDIEQWLLNRQA